jgi:hypothetical protein
VEPGEFLTYQTLSVGTKYKIFLKTEVDDQTGKTVFFLTRFEVPGSKPEQVPMFI